MTDTQNMHGIRSERVSADGVPDDSNIPAIAALRSGRPLRPAKRRPLRRMQAVFLRGRMR